MTTPFLRRDQQPTSPTDTPASRAATPASLPQSKRNSFDSSMLSITKRKRNSFQKFVGLGGRKEYAGNLALRELEGCVRELSIESLTGRDGGRNEIFGPLSSVSGKVHLRLKETKVAAVWIVFRGIVVLQGRKFSFSIVKQKLTEGTLTSGTHSFIFCLRIPGINLPPSSSKPHLHYAFTAHVTPQSDDEVPGDNLDTESISSKEFVVEYIPLLEPIPFEVPDDPESVANRSLSGEPPRNGESKKRPETPKLDIKVKGTGPEKKDSDAAKSPITPTTPNRPTLKINTTPLPPSPSASDETQDYVAPPPPPRTRVLTTVDEHSKPITHLQISLSKYRFSPAGTVPLTISLSIYRPRIKANGFDVSIVEKSWIERRRNGTGVGEIVSEVASRNIATRTLHLPALPEELFNEHQKKEGKMPAVVEESTTPDPIIRYEDRITALVPDLREFVKNSLLPSCSLPLGEVRPLVTASGSGKGKLRSAAHDPSQVYKDLYFTVAHTIKLSVSLPSTGPNSITSTKASSTPVPITSNLTSSPTKTKASPTSSPTSKFPSFNPFAPKSKPQVLSLPIFIGNKTTQPPRFKITPPESAVRSSTPPLPIFRLDPADSLPPPRILDNLDPMDKGKQKSPTLGPLLDPTSTPPTASPSLTPSLLPISRQRTSSSASNISQLSSMSAGSSNSGVGSSLAVGPGTNGPVRKRSVGWKDMREERGFGTLLSTGGTGGGVRFVEEGEEF